MAIIDKLSAIGDAIREKTQTTGTMKLDEMPAKIRSIETGGGELPAELFNPVGNGTGLYSRNHWNWLVERYGEQLNLDGLKTYDTLFNDSTDLKNIPITINVSSDKSLYRMCNNCKNTLTIPILKGTADMTNECFNFCYNANNFQEALAGLNLIKDSYSYQNSMFLGCKSMRIAPTHLFANHSKTNSIYKQAFQSCYSLDRIVELPLWVEGSVTGDLFYSAFSNCARLDKLTFNDTGKTLKAVNQMIDLSNRVGYGDSYIKKDIIECNNNISAEVEVTNLADYSRLKNNPNWWTIDVDFSRYNYKSAKDTLASLPQIDPSVSGTNTIKFYGRAGAKTDAGAINKLTSSEIAVAAAKGWTVALR